MSENLIFKALNEVENTVRESTAELADRVLRLEQKGTGRNDGHTSTGQSLGTQVVKAFEESRSLFEKTRSVRLDVNLDLKAAGDAITTTSARAIMSGGVGAPQGGVLGLQNGLNARPMSGISAIEYSRFTGQQGAAAVQAAEGDMKAAVRPDHTLITQTAHALGHFAEIAARQVLPVGAFGNVQR